MPYSEQQIAALKKYRIMKPDGTFRQVNLQNSVPPGGPPPGLGPVVSEPTLQRLLGSDKTPDTRWADWIMFQAGGGEKAKAATAESFRQIRERFIDERVVGFPHPETGVFFPGVPRAEAEARWAKNEHKFREVLSVCDQDSSRRLYTFGYFREWPGKDNRYAHVVDAMDRYMKIYPKIVKYNKEVVKEGAEPMPDSPEGIPTIEKMVEVATKVERYFASRKARSDIRHELIYDDDVITALAPLTYAAAVRYGYSEWPWASRTGFETVLTGERPAWQQQDAWKSATSGGSVIVYLSFKVPVPAWVTRREGNWHHVDLVDLALKLTKQLAQQNPDAWVVYDQENKNKTTIAEVIETILAEPTRKPEPEEEDPLKVRGGNVYKTEEEARRVVDSLKRAIIAVRKWVIAFDVSKIKTDVLTLD